MVMIVLNNHGYGAMKSFSRLLGDSEPPGIRLSGISYVDVARGFGAVGVKLAPRPSLLKCRVPRSTRRTDQFELESLCFTLSRGRA
jgi:thiamine pyrophosphate-dependent acetolactate synthase large subunit-like protein